MQYIKSAQHGLRPSIPNMALTFRLSITVALNSSSSPSFYHDRSPLFLS